MSKKEIEQKMRRAAVWQLSEKGFTVDDVSSGSGVPKLSRLELSKSGSVQNCITKFTTSGRIHFVREGETFKVLHDFDLVLHIYASSYDSECVKVSLFTRATVEKAFNAAYEALVGVGQANIPIWLSPEFEDGLRFTGSGFTDEALWSEVVNISNAQLDHLAVGDESPESGAGIMEQIKSLLSKHMGVHSDQLEIDVRIKH
ncbi:MAG: hypothetical protein ABJI96_18970 [Paracoccaceae bacterium]